MLAEKKKPPAKKAVAEDDGEEGLEEIKAPVKKPVAKKPAAKAEAIEKGKNLANEMGKADNMEQQKQVQNVVIQIIIHIYWIDC